MATSELTRPSILDRDIAVHAPAVTARSVVASILSVLASLRLTVALFAMSIFLIYMGTLAQKDHDVWDVVNNTHLRTWIAWIGASRS